MKEKLCKNIVLILGAVILSAVILSFYVLYQEEKENRGVLQRKEAIRIEADMKGREVAVPDSLSRVVTVGGAPIINTLIAGLGEGNTIVNGLPFTANRSRISCCKYQTIIVDRLGSLPCIENGEGFVDTEKLMLLKPMLVFTCFEKNFAVEEQVGVPVFYLSVPKSGKDLKSAMRRLAAAYDKVQAAEDWCAYFDGVLNLIERRVKNIEQTVRPKTLYLSGAEPLRSSPVAEWLIESAGGRFPSGDRLKCARGIFSLEEILLWEPDIWLVPSPADVKRVYENPKFQNLKAVKNKKVYAIPAGMLRWSHPTSELVLGLMWVAQLLYPDKFSDISLKEEMKHFYKNFCGYDISNFEIEDILRTEKQE